MTAESTSTSVDDNSSSLSGDALRRRNPATASGSTSRRASSARRLRIYYVLAAINLISVSAEVIFGSRLMRTYSATVGASRESAEVRDRFVRLDELAIDADQPGNDIFSLHDVESGLRRLADTHASYRRESASTRTLILRSLAPSIRPKLSRSLDSSDASVAALVAEAKLALARFGRDPASAAAHLTAMDRHFDEVIATHRAARAVIAATQHAEVQRELALAATFHRYSTATGAGTLLIVFALLLYGRGISAQLETRVSQRTAELRASEERFRLVSLATNDILWDWDLETGRVWHSDALRTVLGIDPEHGHTSDWWFERVHPEDRGPLRDLIASAVESGEDSFEHQYRVRRADGSYAVVLDRGRIARDEAGRGTRALGSVMDVSERQKSEAQLAAQHAFLRQVIDTIPNFVFAKDRDGRYTLANRALAEAYGVTPGELLGHTDAEFSAASDEREHFWLIDRQVMDTLSEHVVPEETITDATGNLRWLQTVKRPIVNADGQANQVLGISTDITSIKQAKQSLAQLAAIVEASDDAILSVDRAGVIQSWNRGAERLFGQSAHAAIGQSLTSLLPVGEPSQRTVLAQQILRDASVRHLDTIWRRKDGTNVAIALTVSPLRNDAEAAAGFALIASDITERLAIESELRRSRANLADAQRIARVGSWERDLVTGQSRWSDEIFRQIGLEPQSITPDFATFLAVVHPDDRARIQDGIQEAIKTGEPFAYVMRFVLPDGTVRTHQARGRVERDESGAALRTVGTSLDITAQTEIEAELRAARETAERASRAKSEFLANMSHEIRTPMNGVLGMLELTLDTPLTAEQLDYITTAHASAEALLGIINDILDFSKIEAGKFDLEVAPFELGEDFSDALGALALRAHEKHVELAMEVAPDVPDVLLGDVGRLRQVLVNLLGNAIKFTSQGEVALRVTLEEREADDVVLRFAVTDTGVGIPPEKQRIIFDAFQQADTSTTREYGGTGLGLAISARLVKLLGGSLDVESEPGVGSTFAFVARFGVTDKRTSERRHTGDVALSGVSVLVVDDNATNRRVVGQMLEREGMRPTLASSGVEALAMLEETLARHEVMPLLLTDVEMPGMSGFQLIETIRARPGLSSASVLMLSSAHYSREVARCRELGVQQYLVKPVRRSRLLAAIRSTLVPGAVEATNARPASVQPREHLARHVLLAEDNAVNRKLAVNILERAGHTVDSVANGRQALDALTENVYDVILMDVQMPEMGGLDATRVIRERERASGGHVPIIALTARAMQGDREECLAAGMDDYVTKPLRAATLLGAIDSVTGNKSDKSAAAVTEAVAEVLDESALLHVVSGDRALLRDVVALFLEDCALRLQELRSAVRAGQRRTIEAVCHALKGAAGSLGAQRAADVAARLEASAIEGALVELGDLVDELATELGQACHRLDAIAAED